MDDGRKYILNKDYDGTLDIISAYKSLKQAINKPATVHTGSNAN